MMNTNYIVLKTNAFLLNASSLQVNFGKLKVDEKTQHVIKENSKGDYSLLYLPNAKLDSKIVSYDLFV